MDSYRNSMDDFNPNTIHATGTMMCEEPILLVESVPQQTIAGQEQNMEQEMPVPKYLAPKKIEVKRYVLKK